MDITQIKYVIKTMELKNFTKAADALFITQPTLSQQIIKLENELHLKLFDRTTRSFEITEAGQVFFNYGQSVIESFQTLTSKLDAMSQHKLEPLKIGILPTLSRIGASSKIAKYLKENKAMNIEFIESWSETLLEMIDNKKLDLALVNLAPHVIEKLTNEIHHENLFIDEIIVIASVNNTLARKKTVHISELAVTPLVNMDPRSSIYKIMQQEFLKRGIKPNYVFECSSTSTLVNMVSEDVGISFLTKRVASKINTDTVKLIKLTPSIMNYTSIVILKNSLHANIVKELKDIITHN